MIEDPPARPLFIPPGTPPSQVPSQDGRPTRVLASARRRIIARLIDLTVTPLMMSAPLMLLMMVLFKVANTGSGLTGIAIGIAVAGGFVNAIGGWFLARVFRFARYGCTVGQRIAGIRVVRLQDGVRNPSWGQAFRRWMSPWGGDGGSGPLTPLGDIWAYWRDTRTRQCLHDEKSETVVVLAQKPERLHRVLLGSPVALVVLALITFSVVTTVKGEQDDPLDEPRPFQAEQIFADRQTIGDGTRAVTLDPIGMKTHATPQGCLTAASNAKSRALLTGLGCDGRLEALYRTPTGVLISSQILRFPEAAAAITAGERVTYTDLQSLPGGPLGVKGGALAGNVGRYGRYIAVTCAVSPRQPGAARQARDPVMILHPLNLASLSRF